MAKVTAASHRNRIRSLHKYLVPNALGKLIAAVDEDQRRLPRWDRRIEALDRLINWTEQARSIAEFRELVFQSNQIGNVLELARAMRVLREESSAPNVRVDGLANDEMVALRQILLWWRDRMTDFPSVTDLGRTGA